MTATLRGRPSSAAVAASRRASGQGWVWTLVGVFIGLLAGAGWWTTLPASWSSTGTVVLSGVQDVGSGPGNSLFVANGLVQGTVPLLAVIAESDAVSDAAGRALGLERGALGGAVKARPVPGASAVDITVTRPRPTKLVEVANSVLRTAISQTMDLQSRGAGRVLVQADIGSAASAPVDGHRRALGFVLALGAVFGGGIGAAVAAVRRPVPGERRLARWDPDAGIRSELARWRRAARRPAVIAVAAAALVLLLAYGATGSALPVWVLGLACCAAALRDLRWVVVGSLLLGLGAPNPRIKLVSAGAVTLSIQDVLLLTGLAVVLCRWWSYRVPTDEPRALFAGPVLAFVGVTGLGAAVGYLGGAGRADLAEPVRVLLILPVMYLLVVQAYRQRPAQLVLTLIGCSVVSSILSLLATPLGWTSLLGDVRDYVITDSAAASVTRLANPVLVIWSVLLVVLAAGVAKGTPRWLWAVAALPGVALVALSFNRSTWGPLLVVVILAAAFRGGLSSMVRRAALMLVVGGIALAVALTGALGSQVDQLGIRAMSAITGEATHSNSLNDRLIEDAAAVSTLEDNPLFGTGIGRPYGAYSLNYDPTQGTTVVSDQFFIHNQYLRVWLILGLPGLAALMGLVVRLVRATVELARGMGTTSAAVPLAVALGLLCAGAQAIFQTSLLDRPTMMLTGTSLALIEIFIRTNARSARSVIRCDQIEAGRLP